MVRSLITGGAGFIGSHLAEHLLEAGHEVAVLDDLSTGRLDNLAAVAEHPRFRFEEASIADAERLAEHVAEADEIYHLAAAVGVRLVAEDPVRTIETNIYPTQLVLRLAAGQGGLDRGDAEKRRPGERRPKRVFLASTSEVYGKNPKSPLAEDDDMHFGPTVRGRWAYGCSKAIDEFLALAYYREYGLPVIVGRFFNVVGPRQVGRYGMVVPRFVDQALAGGPVVVYDDGRQVRCFGHVRDVVQGVAALMRTPAAVGKVFNLGNDQPVTIRELAETVVRLVDPNIEIRHIPYSEAYAEGFEDIRHRVPDLTRLRSTIDYRIRYRLADILDELIRSKQKPQRR